MTTVSEVAHASPADIEILLRNAAPFESGKIIQQGESEHDVKVRNELRSFWVTGKKGITEAEAARLIVEEARDMLQKDLGIQINEWDTESMESHVLKTGQYNMLHGVMSIRQGFFSPQKAGPLTELVSILLIVGSNERKSAIGNKSYDTKECKLAVARKEAHLSYLSDIPKNTIAKSRPLKLKDKSPLERAKEKIKMHGEKFGTGRIVKEKTKRKNASRLRNDSNTHTASLVQSISSPNFNNINGTSTPVKKHEKSFDTSAQIEEIFDVQRDEINVHDAVEPVNMSPNEYTKPTKSDLPCAEFEDQCSAELCNELNPR